MEPWVKQKKLDAAQKRMLRPGPNLTSGAMYTGAGSDGVVQKDQPAGVGMSGSQPFMFHEGEMKTDLPEGSFMLNSRTTKRAYPSFAAGGFLSNITKKAASTVTALNNAAASLPATNPYNEGTRESSEWNKANAPAAPAPNPTGYKTGYTDELATKGTQTNPYNSGTREFSEWNKVNSAATNPPGTPEMAAPTGYKSGYMDELATKGTVSNPYNPGTKEYSEWNKANTTPTTVASDITNEIAGTASLEANPTGYKSGYTAELATKGTQPGMTPTDWTSVPAPTTNPPGTPTVAAPTAEDDARNAGLKYLQDQLSKTSGAISLEAKTQVDALIQKQQQERSAAEQRAIQSGVDPQQARIEAQMLRNQQETELNDLGAKYGIAGMQARDTAAANLASTGLAGQQFEQSKAQYGDTKAWTDFEYTAQYGSDADVISAYKAATGKDLDPSAVAEIRGYARTKRAQDVTQGDISITSGQISNEAAKLSVDAGKLDTFIKAVNNGSDLAAANSISGLNLTEDQFSGIRQSYTRTQNTQDLQLEALKNSLGDTEWTSVQNMLNTGASLKQVNDRLATQGKDPLSQEEYSAMLDTTPLAERNWGRNLSAANMLLTNGNWDAAAKAYKELFPGTDIDFSNLKDAKKGEDFSSGMADLASYIVANMDSTAAIKALSSSGALGRMGITEEDAINLYDSMQVNALDEEWNVIEGSKAYQGLSDEDKTAMRDLFEAKLTGKLDYTTLHEYEITGKDGTVTTIYGEDSTEADKAAAKNGGTVKDTGKVQYQLSSTINTATTSTTGPTPAVNDAWTKFEESQANIPNKVSYDDFKTAWEKAGKPSSYTYDNYAEEKNSGTPKFSQAIYDKYENGWTSDIKTRGNRENTPYIPSTGHDTIIAAVKSARDVYLSSPEKVVSVGKSDIQSKLEEYAKNSNATEYGGIANPEYSKSNPLVIEGYSVPMYFYGVVPGIQTGEEYYYLVSLDDGELIPIKKE